MTEQLPLWQLCERAWAGYLAGAGHLVTRLADAKGGDEEDGAPLLQMGDKWYRALCKQGRTQRVRGGKAALCSRT